MIDGVKIVPLRQIVDERGKIMHMLKRTDPHFIEFGEIYISCAWPGTVKVWHVHRSMTINNAVVSGRAKLVMYDLRDGSPTKGKLQEVFFGEDNYCLVQMPPGIPVATVGVGSMGAKNAGHLSAAILALEDSNLRRKVETLREQMEREVLEKSKGLPRRLREVLGGEK